METTREELYRRVWESPVVAIAKEFDISDVGLSKACRAHAIPLPPRGYWTKLRHGKQVARPALPASAISRVVIDAPRHRVRALGKRSKVGVTEDVNVLVHPFLEGHKLAPYAHATKKELRSIKHPHALVSSHRKDEFDCRVSKSGIDAACQLLDAIERAAPAFNGVLMPGEKSLEFVHEEQAVAFRILEQYTTAEVSIPGKVYSSWERPTVVQTFTGKFTLEILGYFDGQKKWADGKRQKLADVLSSFMGGLVVAAKALKQRRLDREDQQRRWREEAERRAEQAQREKDLADFRSNLLTEAQLRREQGVLRDYFTQLQITLSEFVGPLPESAMRWLRTTESLASAPDVLVNRMRILTSGVKGDYYSGSFGKPIS